jgi:hypothetical protein
MKDNIHTTTFDFFSFLKKCQLYVIFQFCFLYSIFSYSQHQCQFQPGNPSGTLTTVCFHQYNHVSSQMELMGCLSCQITGNQIKCGNGAIADAGYSSYDMITWSTASGDQACVNPAVLPIILGKFEYKYNQFYWTTLSELNNDYFTIEKSYDNEEWEEIASIPSSVNTSSNLTNYSYRYEYTDFQTSYYRLSQVDFNGTKVYFEPIVVESSQKQNIQLFPNPSEDGLITIKTNLEIVSYKVLDFSGKEIYEVTKSLDQLNLSLLNSGIYQIYFSHKNGTTSCSKVVRY